MDTELNKSKIQWLTYLVYFLLATLTIVTSWTVLRVDAIQMTISKLPQVFVQKERYLTDKIQENYTLGRIENKLDRLIDRSGK